VGGTGAAGAGVTIVGVVDHLWQRLGRWGVDGSVAA
jgi:hypothetical protein